MNPELTRRYTQPIPVSSATALHYRHRTTTIPDPHELQNIKADLEAILPLAEKRMRHLHRDLSTLKKSVKVRDMTEEEEHLLIQQKKQQQQQQQEAAMRKVGKTTSPSMMDKVKQESSEESSDMFHSTSHNKSQMERQLALEALRRKRRRDDDPSKSSSGSPHNNHTVKLKRLDDSPLLSNNTSKSHTKKKKANGSSNKQQQQQLVKNNNNNEDFVRVKQKDQIPILTFWTTLDPHFGPLSEEDREFLLEKPDDEKYYHIPSLGRHFSSIWNEDNVDIPLLSHSPASTANSSVDMKYIHSYDQITDDLLYKDESVSCGYLTERLLSSLVNDLKVDETMVEENHDVMEQDEEEEEEEEDDDDDDQYMGNMTSDSLQFEERLKSELRYAGLFGEDDIDYLREDDEICAELRSAQRELKLQYTKNESRKKKLLNIVDNQLQYEQYRHVLDNLDVQVEQCYLKRFRTQKSKKRKTPASMKSALSEHAVHAMGKRKAWVDALEGIFKDKNLIMPTQTIYDENE